MSIAISLKAPIVGMNEAWTAEYAFGDTLEEAVEKYGADVVLNLAGRMVKTDIQNACRAQANSFMTEEMENFNKALGEDEKDQAQYPEIAVIHAALQKRVDEYVPGVQRVAVKEPPSQEALLAHIASLDPTSPEFAAFLAALEAKAGQ